MKRPSEQKQRLRRWMGALVSTLAGGGVAAVLLLAVGTNTHPVVAAPPASGPYAPALNAAAGITVVKTAPSLVYQAVGAGQTLICRPPFISKSATFLTPITEYSSEC